jgi:hypothetical protein
MRMGADHARDLRGRGGSRCVSQAVVLVAVGALLVASFVHLMHEHPHRPGQEVTCAVCTTPLGQTAVSPALVPPSMRPEVAPTAPPSTPPTVRVPLSFSPKQSPPAST